jgi:hypothetical protein
MAINNHWIAELKTTNSNPINRAGPSGLQTGIVAISWFISIPDFIMSVSPQAVRALKLSSSLV